MMNKPKFTPGPWVMEHDKTFGENLIQGPNWDVVFEGGYHGDAYAITVEDADARLIVKAPEMYDFIYNVLGVLKTVYDPRSSFAQMTEEYINKAQELLKEINGE